MGNTRSKVITDNTIEKIIIKNDKETFAFIHTRYTNPKYSSVSILNYREANEIAKFIIESTKGEANEENYKSPPG